MMIARWTKLVNEFYNDGAFDSSKIPDVFDSCRYDLLYNKECLGLDNNEMHDMWLEIGNLADFVIPQEYGVTRREKTEISRKIAFNFFQDIRAHLQKSLEDGDQTRCFLYFSSESHIHALRNALIMGESVAANSFVAKNVEGMELAYLSHGVIRLFENPYVSELSSRRFYATVHFSPGAHGNPLTQADDQLVPIEIPGCLNGNLSYDELLKFLSLPPLNSESEG